MFNEFCKFFSIQGIYENENTLVNGNVNAQNSVLGYSEFLNNFHGKSFGKGLYRIHEYNDIKKWNRIVSDTFPEFQDRIDCFGYDWLGRQFSLDNKRIICGEPQILMFEPGTGEVLEIPCSFIEFHESEITNYHDACLASAFFNDWINILHEDLPRKKCAGYKIPLFLGGADSIDNLELSDMEVYWELCGQLILKTRDLTNGTKIGHVLLNDELN